MTAMERGRPAGATPEIVPVDGPPEQVAPGGRIGLLALATDFTSEAELRRMLPAGVGLFTNRIANANPITLETLAAMEGDIGRAAGCLLPNGRVDAFIYGCTSGALAIGPAAVAARIAAARPGARSTDPLSAAAAALETMGARRLSILTPYTVPINAALAAHFGGRGFTVLNIAGFDLDDDEAMASVAPEAIARAARRVCRPDADALFISCTALHAATVLDAVERALDRPVVASNQALLWHALRLIGHQGGPAGFGRLFGFGLAGAE